MEDYAKELKTLRTTLENLTSALMNVSNKLYKIETNVKLLSQEDSPPQKRQKPCSPIWRLED